MDLKLAAVYVGWPKCGSTWLHRLCEATHELTVSPAKDINFFDRKFEKGRDWFYRQFPRKGGATRVIDIGHDYVFSRSALERIRAFDEDTKLIVFLRYPADWIVSEYDYVRSTGRVSIDMAGFLDEYRYVSEYARFENYLASVLDIFPADRVLIVFQEDLASDAASFVRKLCAFLGVGDDGLDGFDPSTRVNAGLKPRFPFVGEITAASKSVAQRLGLERLHGLIKMSFVKRLLYKEASRRSEIPREMLEILMPQFVRTRQAVEAMAARNLPHWRERETELGERHGS